MKKTKTKKTADALPRYYNLDNGEALLVHDNDGYHILNSAGKWIDGREKAGSMFYKGDGDYREITVTEAMQLANRFGGTITVHLDNGITP